MTGYRRIRLLIALIVLCPAIVRAADTVPGPFVAMVVSAYDGDTLAVSAYPSPGVTITMAVWVNGIDTPEIRGRRDAGTEPAKQARDLAMATVGNHAQLTDVTLGERAGRIIADVLLADGQSLGPSRIAVISPQGRVCGANNTHSC